MLNKYIRIFIIIVSIIKNTQSQEIISLQDLESGKPIIEASFQYGDQSGISDRNGIIHFIYEKEQIMSLSHINYGRWTLGDQEIQEAIENKIILRRPLSVDLFPVTIIAVKPSSPQPEGIHNINYEDRMAHDAASILNQRPAFNSIRKGGNYGFDPVFRGFKYDQINVVMNGAQSATAACPNRMDPPTSQMAPNMMERITILKGPHALRYGAGIGATINFVPRQLNFSKNLAFNGRLSSGYESNGNLMRGESQIGLTTHNYDLSLYASWSQGQDYRSGNDNLIPADFERGSFGTNLGVKLSDKQEIRFSATYNRARDADFPALPMDLREDDTWLFNVRHEVRFNADHLQSWNTTLFGSFVDHKMDNLLKPLNPRMLNAATLAITRNYGGRTEGFWRFGHNKLYAGADFRIEGAEGRRTREFIRGPMAGIILTDNAWQDGEILKSNLFAEYLIKGKTIDYVFSTRIGINRSEINDPSSEFTEVYPDTKVTQLNPSFSLGMIKNFGGRYQLGFWLARAQRSGSLTERFINYFPVGQDPYEMLGNPLLKPEKNNQIDINLDWKTNDKTTLEIDVFTSYLQDYISSVIDTNLTQRMPMSPGVRQFLNINEAFKMGFEFNWTQEIFAGMSHRLGVAYTYGQDLERDQPLPEIAPLDLRYNLSGSYIDGKLSPSITFRYVAGQERVSEEFGEMTTPAFQVLDVKLGYQVNDKLSINIGVNNLLNKQYFEHLNRQFRGTNNPIFAVGRNIFTNVNYSF